MAWRRSGDKPLSEPMMVSLLTSLGLNMLKQWWLSNAWYTVHPKNLRTSWHGNAFWALLALCEGNSPVSGWIPSQTASDAELWWFVVSWEKLLNKQSIYGWFQTQWCMGLFALQCFFADCIPVGFTLTNQGYFLWGSSALQWRHNECNGDSNHRPVECLLNRLYRRRSKKTSVFRVTGLCGGNPPWTGEFPSQRASNAENVSVWWCHHGLLRNNPKEYGQMDHMKPRENKAYKTVCIFHGIYCINAIRTNGVNSSSHPWTKWPPFRRRYFQMHFPEWKFLYFD